MMQELLQLTHVYSKLLWNLVHTSAVSMEPCIQHASNNSRSICQDLMDPYPCTSLKSAYNDVQVLGTSQHWTSASRSITSEPALSNSLALCLHTQHCVSSTRTPLTSALTSSKYNLMILHAAHTNEHTESTCTLIQSFRQIACQIMCTELVRTRHCVTNAYAIDWNITMMQGLERCDNAENVCCIGQVREY